MSLRKRLLMAIALAAPLAWLSTMGLIYYRTHREINELYDTDMVRVAQQLQALLPAFSQWRLSEGVREITPSGDLGYAGLRNVAVSVWTPQGKRLSINPDADPLPINAGRQGFIDQRVSGHEWRLYYLQAPQPNDWRVVVGQRLDERHEMINAYLLGQTLPWLAGLAILVAALVFGIRQALRPVLAISQRIARRDPDDPTPLDSARAPREIQPLLQAINQLLGKTAAAIERERRLTADAAHELRTPLAALRAQWDAGLTTKNPAEKRQAERNVETGLERMNHLITQLLDMARLEKANQFIMREPIHWPEVVRQALSDCLVLSGRKGIDIEVIWPPTDSRPLPMTGDSQLLILLLRNLLDNAVRYSPEGSTVLVEFTEDRLQVSNPGNGVPPEQLERLGDRFFRGEGQSQSGSGLGLSIVRRIAAGHGLLVTLANRIRNGRVDGFSVTLRASGR